MFVQHFGQHERRPGRVDVDAVAHHAPRVNGVAEAGLGPHFGPVEGAREEGDEAEPGESGPPVVFAAPVPEARDGDGEGGGDVVAEGEEGTEVRVHAARAAAALARPDEVVEFARFGAFGLVGVTECCGLGGMGGGRCGDDAFERGDLIFGCAEGGAEVGEAGEEVGVCLEVGEAGGSGYRGDGLGGRGWLGG